MYRVLIVDDENYVVDWVANLLEEQKDLDLDVCRAYNPSDALTWFERARIDILVSDIRMPKITGLDLAEKIRLNWPQCKVILFTAYAEFNYAYEAFKNKVDSFILKDEDDDHIIGEIRKVIQMINDENSHISLVNTMRGRLKETMQAIQSDILLEMLEDPTPDRDRWQTALQQVEIDLDLDQPFLLLASCKENQTEHPMILEQLQLLWQSQSVIAHYLGFYFRIYPTKASSKCILWILQPIGLNENIRPNILVAGLLDSIQSAINHALKLQFSFLLHDELLTLTEVFRLLPLMKAKLEEQIADQNGFVITGSGQDEFAVCQERHALPDESEYRDPAVLLEKVRNSLDNKRLVTFKQALDEISTFLARYGSWTNPLAQELYFTTAAILISCMNRYRLSEPVTHEIDLTKLFRPQETRSWQEAGHYLQRLGQVLGELLGMKCGSLADNIITAVKSYISNYITSDTSLVRLSEMTGYSAPYLSHLFREKTGITLVDYTAQVKMNLIRQLMLDENNNISDIADKAGFDSRPYFNNFFKRMTGMSPQEYRAGLTMRIPG